MHDSNTYFSSRFVRYVRLRNASRTICAAPETGRRRKKLATQILAGYYCIIDRGTVLMGF